MLLVGSALLLYSFYCGIRNVVFSLEKNISVKRNAAS